MKRILVTMPDELHELLRELALRKKTSVSKLLLAAAEDSYEDEIDVIAGERGLEEYLRNPGDSISIEDYIARRRERSEVCPLCSAPMKIKSGRRGRFLCCSRYPACRGTIALEAAGAR